MILQDLEDRLYTSTEVANVLGVSLRSVYRYLEDDKLKAEMKTATGRHRFTKQNILDFMSPQAGSATAAPAAPAAAPVAEPVAAAPAAEVAPEAPAAAPAPVTPVAETPAAPAQEGQEDVDWLSKFRQAAEKYKAEAEPAAAAPAEVPAPAAEAAPAQPQEAVSGLAAAPAATPAAAEAPAETSPSHYYKSGTGGLKDIAQNIDKSAKKASLEYAFTMDAGLSLHKPISPFSLIHAYVRSEDLAFFEKILDLTPAPIADAQLCLIVSDVAGIYSDKREVHGLNVVADAKLKEDLTAAGKAELAAEVA